MGDDRRSLDQLWTDAVRAFKPVGIAGKKSIILAPGYYSTERSPDGGNPPTYPYCALSIPGLGSLADTANYFYVNPVRYFTLQRPLNVYINRWDPEFQLHWCPGTPRRGGIGLQRTFPELTIIRTAFPGPWALRDTFSNAIVETGDAPFNALIVPPGKTYTYEILADL